MSPLAGNLATGKPVINEVIIGMVTSATASTLSDASKTFTNDLVGHHVLLFSGTGAGQTAIILGAVGSQLLIDRNWTTTPSTDTQYAILADKTTSQIYVQPQGSTAQTATFNAGFAANYDAVGVLIHINITAYTDGTWTPSLQFEDYDGNFTAIWTAAAGITANGDYYYLFYPTAATALLNMTERAVMPLPSGIWRIRVVLTGGVTKTLTSIVDAQYLH